ncbi:MAG: flagellar export chaperone FlgN [Christensenellales bacterium]
MNQVHLEQRENYINELKAIQSILVLAQQQEGMLQQDDARGFQKTMKEREKIVQSVVRLDEERIQMLHRLEEGRDNSSVMTLCPDLKVLKEAICQSLIKIEQLDTSNKTLAEKKMEECKKQIRALHQTTKMVRAYKKPFTGAGGELFDKKK